MSARGKTGDAPSAPEEGVGVTAMAAGLRRGRGKDDPELEAYLRKLSELLDLRIHEHPLELAHLKTRRWQDRAQLALLAGTAALVLAGAAGLMAMTFRAAGSRDIIVDPFSVTPELAARGLTGPVIAQHVLDELSAMDARAQSTTQAPAGYRTARDEPIKIEIPETGVSLGDLDRYLRRWLGHETHVSGEIVRTAAGYELTSRYGDAEAAHQQGAEDIRPLVHGAAEAVFLRARPLRYADYLTAQGRGGEALPILREEAQRGTSTHRALALSTWASLLQSNGDLRGSLEKAHAAVRLDPQNGIAQAWVASAAWLLGRQEEALRAARTAVRTLPSPPADAPRGDFATVHIGYFEIIAKQLVHDHAGALQTWTRLEESGGFESLGPPQRFGQRAYDAAASHDIGLARRIISEMPEAPPSEPEGARQTSETVIASYAQDWTAAARPHELAPQFTALQVPFVAEAMARSGDVAGARSLIASAPLDCDACLQARAKVAAIGGDWPDAQRWFAAAERQAPSTPDADQAWGQALLARGDAQGAIEKARAAHRKGPRWADPLALWGEALMAKRDFNGAVEKFEAAEPLAPKWGRLHLKWAEALAMLGRIAEARAHLRAASALDLSGPERAELGAQKI
jgi:tetratricopeptide (TPR) repeat protein